MKAIILSAGNRNEISQIVGDIPKGLIEVNNTTIIEMQLNVLHACGIDDVCVVKGYKEELIDIPGVKYYLNDEYELNNILYTLFCAEEELEDEILIIYGDVAFNKECLERIISSKKDISLGIAVNLESYKKDNIKDLEIIYLDSDNNIINIDKNLNYENEAYGQFTGIMKCNKNGTEIIKNNYKYFKIYNKNYKNALISELLNNIISLGNKVFGVIIERGWIKINSVDDYKKLKESYEEFNDSFNTQTNWAIRSELYNNIIWVNKEETLETMYELSDNKTTKPKILDIGVGTGKVLKYFKDRINEADCYGIDISNEMMSKIEKSYKFKLSVGNVEDLSEFDDNTFDLITARMSFHHVKHLDKAMIEVYRVLKKGGKFIICEGVPPNMDTLEFYKEMFKYKEDRNTFLTDDLINLMNNVDLEKITTRTIINKDMSMNNWLNNSGIPFRNEDIIRKMHFECGENIKKSYKMKIYNEDILMEWKFVVACGIK